MLRRVAEQEEIEAPDAAIGLIARHATGSFRDALGTLEQLVTYGGPKIELDDVLEIMGAADAELVLDTAEALIDHDPKGVLLAVEKLSSSGRDIAHFMSDLSEHLRHLFVVQTLGEVPATFAVTAEHTDRLNAQADRLPQAEVLRAIDLLARARTAVKDGSEPRIQLELALLKAVQPQADLSIQALLFRIEQLERKLDAGEPPRRRASPARRSASPVIAATRAARRRRRSGAPGWLPCRQEEPEDELDIELVRGLWPAVLDAVRERERDGRRSARRGAPDRDRGVGADGELPRGRRVLAQEGRRQPRAAADGAPQPDRPLGRRSRSTSARRRRARASRGRRSPRTSCSSG